MTKPSEAQASVPKQMIEAFVLAGARSTGDALAQAHNVASKAHIQIAGVSMISRVLRALSKSQTVAEATIIGLDDKAALGSEDYSISIRFTEGANGPAASVDQALRTRKEPEPILVTTCDHALLSPDIIDTFLDRALTSGADVAVALARRETIEGDYPDATRTYLRFGDGDYSSCNLFCLMSPAAGDVVKFWQRAEQDRKRPWRIAWRFGIVSALRLLVGRPHLDQVFAIVSRRLSVDVKPIVLPFAEAAIDVDTEEDLTLVERSLSEKTA